jgi:integrase/recombinase XerD
VKDGLITVKENPFLSVTLKSVAKSKDVLYPEHLKALWEYKPIGIREERGKDLFFFCYLNSGMNFKDVGYLKNKNIKGDILKFVRSKTRTTNRVEKEIKVYLHPEAKKIIETWGTCDNKPESFLFSFFNKCRNAKHLDDTIIRYKRTANLSLRKIGIKLGFNVRITLGLARHSFATKHKLDGTPVAFISEAMGHSSVAVTEHYLKSLPDENLKLLSDKLLSF